MLERSMMIQTVNMELQVLDAQQHDGNHHDPENGYCYSALPRKIHARQFISSDNQKQ